MLSQTYNAIHEDTSAGVTTQVIGFEDNLILTCSERSRCHSAELIVLCYLKQDPAEVGLFLERDAVSRPSTLDEQHHWEPECRKESSRSPEYILCDPAGWQVQQSDSP